MDLEKLQLLLQAPEPENTKIDFKIKLYDINHQDSKVRDMQWDEFIKDILSLANGNVGSSHFEGNLIVGVADKLDQNNIRRLYDVGEINLSAQQVLQKVNAACTPPLPDLEIQVIVYKETRILVVKIPPTPYLHETTRPLKTPKTIYQENTVFIRRREGIGSASTTERQAIIAEKQSLWQGKIYEKSSYAISEIPRLDLIKKHREKIALNSKYARWARTSSQESYIDSAGFQLPLFASPYDDIEDSSEDLLQCMNSCQRLLILGEPGMGKTVALERITLDWATSTAIKVPVFIPLIHYEVNLVEIIVTSLNEVGILNIKNLADLEFLMNKYDFAFLFDGLNEVSKSNRERLIVELSAFLRAHPSQTCIITSRSQDELWRRFHSSEMIETVVVIRRISDEQILSYLAAHLGEKEGLKLHDSLNKALLGLAKIPLLLWMIKEAGLSGEELPGNRGELINRFIYKVFNREQKQTSTTTLPTIKKIQVLSEFAFYLYQDHRLTCSRQEAFQAIQYTHQDMDASLLLDELLRNGLLLGENKIRFMHQAIQEQFVALKIEGLISSVMLADKVISTNSANSPSGVDLKRKLRTWAKDEWWSEVIVQLSGITERQMFLSKQVLLANPWLAYWCSIEGQSLSKEMQSQIEKQTVSRLQSEKVVERLQVVRELARMENPRTTKVLLTALSDPASDIQSLAIQTMVRLGEPSVDPLLESLDSKDDYMRWAVTRALGMIWRFHEMVNFGATDASTRRRASVVLGNLADERAVLPLIAGLRDSEVTVRIEAALSLGKLRDTRAVAPLISALEKSYKRTYSTESAAISKALSLIHNPTEELLLSNLKEADLAIRQSAFIALGRIWMLPEIADLASSEPEMKQDAAKKLGQLSDPRVVEPLLTALLDPDQQLRWDVTRALGTIWKLPLLIDLGNSQPSIRQNAATNLGLLGDKRAIKPLVAALRDRDHWVRETSADALRYFDEAIDILVPLLLIQDRETRISAVNAIVRLNDRRIIEILSTNLYDYRWWVREAVADCLAKMGDAGVPVLAKALESDDSEIRLLARFALRRSKSIEAQFALFDYRQSHHTKKEK